DEHDAVHRRANCAHHTPQQPVHRRSEEPPEHLRHLHAEAIAFEVDEEECQQCERQRDDTSCHLHPDDPRPLDDGGARVHTARASAAEGPEILHPEVAHPVAEPRYLYHPRGQRRRPVPRGGGNIPRKRNRLAPGHDTSVDERQQQYRADDRREGEGGPDITPPAAELRPPTVIDRGSRDRQHHRPAKRRNETPQHPGAGEQQRADQHVTRGLLGYRRILWRHAETPGQGDAYGTCGLRSARGQTSTIRGPRRTNQVTATWLSEVRRKRRSATASPTRTPASERWSMPRGNRGSTMRSRCESASGSSPSRLTSAYGIAAAAQACGLQATG